MGVLEADCLSFSGAVGVCVEAVYVSSGGLRSAYVCILEPIEIRTSAMDYCNQKCL